MSIELKFGLHPAQQEIFNSNAAFKVVAAGRRFGKTYLAAIVCIIEALKNVNDRGFKLESDSEVMYLAPTFEQAKGIFWPVLLLLAKPVTKSIQSNIGVLTLNNDVRIRLKGTDNEDRARGYKLRYAVLDEYADMTDTVWDTIILPALSDLEGGALFIGTPKGKNHFYKLFRRAELDEEGDWAAFNFSTHDNPFITDVAVQRLRDNMSHEIEKQEVYASFQSFGGKVFTRDQWIIDPKEPLDGNWYVAIDPAGFSEEGSRLRGKLTNRDECAIALVKVTAKGWWVKEIIHGRWAPRETALRIVRACSRLPRPTVGIESGALKNAIMPYLEDEMRRFNRFFAVHPLSHGGKNKALRIQWALSGRAEKGRIFLNPGPWNDTLIDQSIDFPSKLAHDDLLDALAYIDQLSKTIYLDSQVETLWQPLDEVAGY